MGLLLSVIVIYVSVIEFLTVYSHFRRSFQQSPSSRDMSPLIRRCEEGLCRERRRIINILERYKGPQSLSEENTQKNKAIPALSELDTNLKQNESPFSILPVTCKDVCNSTIWNDPIESHILEVKSTDYFSNAVLIGGSNDSAIKASGKRVKFGASIDEDQRYRFHSPSPISQITNSFKDSKSKSLDNNNYLTQNESLTQFSRFNESADFDLTPEEEAWNAHKKTLSSDEDENKPFYEFDFLQTLDGVKSKSYSRESLVQDLQTNSEASWNPDKIVVSSDENSECNCTKVSRTTKKSRLFRKKKLRSSSLEVKLNNIDVLPSSEYENDIVENVNQNVVLDEVTKEDNSPENAFWLIFSGEYTKAMNKDWHGQHFCCWQCDESLTGQRYVLRDEHPYCVACYESVFANSCEKCSRIIGIDSKDLSYKDKHWHEACFLCATCGDSLVDKQFGSKGERIYCGRCYDEQFASRCDGCGQIFRAGTKKMEYKTRQWHEKCFCCNVCKVPIGTQSFIPREQEIYCAKCYEEKYATRCIKCNKVITSGGVTYKNEPWHRECFTCTHCNTSLAGARFTSRDDKPYCAECFGELFAKRCTACNKPITGIGGTKFISFEDRHWHNDCFFCASCRTSLVGRGFITDADDIICPDCAKKNLM